MTVASYELNNIWHGLGTVGHVALAAAAAIVLLIVVGIWRSW